VSVAVLVRRAQVLAREEESARRSKGDAVIPRGQVAEQIGAIRGRVVRGQQIALAIKKADHHTGRARLADILHAVGVKVMPNHATQRANLDEARVDVEDRSPGAQCQTRRPTIGWIRIAITSRVGRVLRAEDKIRRRDEADLTIGRREVVETVGAGRVRDCRGHWLLVAIQQFHGHVAQPGLLVILLAVPIEVVPDPVAHGARHDDARIRELKALTRGERDPRAELRLPRCPCLRWASAPAAR
jgi:hypothetical protein